LGHFWASSFLLAFACGGDDSATTGGAGAAGSAGSSSSQATGGSGGGGSGGGGAGGGGQGGAGSGGASGASGAGGASAGAGGSTPDAAADAKIDSGPPKDAPSDAASKGEDGAPPPSDATACGALPGSGVYATFRVGNDVFHVSITNANGINQAIALWRGQSMAKIPVGAVECGNGTFNCGWSWRMKPDTVQFAEVTIEVCDGTPSYVQDHCADFARSYCPWGAELTELRDCRTDPSCPLVSR
jgi:hypothetical protein